MIAACTHAAQPYMYGTEPLFHFTALARWLHFGAVTCANIPVSCDPTATTRVPDEARAANAYAAVTPLS